MKSKNEVKSKKAVVTKADAAISEVLAEAFVNNQPVPSKEAIAEASRDAEREAMKASMQTTEVAKAAFAAALLKPKASKRKKALLDKVEDLLAPLPEPSTVQQAASALFAEIESLVKVPEAPVVAGVKAEVETPKAPAVEAPVVTDEELKKLRGTKAKLARTAKAKAPDPGPSGAVEALVARWKGEGC